jgi:hypothetical protein
LEERRNYDLIVLAKLETQYTLKIV